MKRDLKQLSPVQLATVAYLRKTPIWRTPQQIRDGVRKAHGRSCTPNSRTLNILVTDGFAEEDNGRYRYKSAVAATEVIQVPPEDEMIYLICKQDGNFSHAKTNSGAMSLMLQGHGFEVVDKTAYQAWKLRCEQMDGITQESKQSS
jgi:hypothetical protein